MEDRHAAEGTDGRASRLQITGLVLAALGAGLVILLPDAEGLSPEGKRLAAIFLVALALWASEAVPVAITALLVVILQPALRVAPLATAFQSFISPVFFFVFAMFCISTAFTVSGLGRRFALRLLARAGSDTRRVLFAVMAGTALISTITSDVPSCAIFSAIALGLFSRAGIGTQSRFGKAVMLGIPIAALIGGVATPAGSSVNILGIHFIQEFGQVRVPFLHWMAIGVPMVVVLLPIAWLVLLRFCPPESERIAGTEELAREAASLGAVTRSERKVLGIVSTMLVLWIASTWVEVLDVVWIGLAGAVVMFLPGIGLLRWPDVEAGTGWDTLLMIGGVTSIGAASVETGLAEWIVEHALAGTQGWVPAALVAAISTFTVIIHLVLPIGPVINAVLIPPIALLAVSAGENPILYCLPVAFTASAAFLLPIDAVPLITYSHGYYKMLDMLLPGLVISAFWVAAMTVLMLVIAPAVGLI